MQSEFGADAQPCLGLAFTCDMGPSTFRVRGNGRFGRAEMWGRSLEQAEQLRKVPAFLHWEGCLGWKRIGWPHGAHDAMGRRRKSKPLDGVRARKTGLSVQPQHSCGDQSRQRPGPKILPNGEERQGHRDIEFVDFSSPQGWVNVQSQGLSRPPNIHALQGRSDPCEAGQCGGIG